MNHCDGIPHETPQYEQPSRKIDVHDLRNYLDRFQIDNAHSPDVELRWLATYAGDLKTMAFHVKTGNHDTIKKQVNDFRLREIEAAKQKLHAEANRLETEETRLLREIEQIVVNGSDA